MAKRQKTKRFSIQAYDNEHYRLTEQYTRAVDALFNAATKAIADVAAKGEYDPNKPFTYKDHPKVQRAVHKVTKQLADRLVTVIETGSKKQWLFACAKNDAFIAAIMDTSKLRKGRLTKMQDKNLDALQAFQQRKVDGMNLSQRVWNYVGQYKDQMEQALDVGLGEGRSAQQLARDVRQNLVEPNRLFRRVRDKHGNLVLSKAAKAYHPGRGVYRSSVKNAQRLTRSEINMAYRESDYRRWQQLDFVIGIEVKRSNHEPLFKCDLCEQLVGKYPKTFKFVGWHPQCMCYAVPILADAETTDKNTLSHWRNVLYGEEYKKYEAKGTVKDVPDGFKQWVEDHVERQKGWANTPYFIRDNFKNGLLKDGLKPLFDKTKIVAQPQVDPIQLEINALMPRILEVRKKSAEYGGNGYLALEQSLQRKDLDKIKRFLRDAENHFKDLDSRFQQFVNDVNATIQAAQKANVQVHSSLKSISKVSWYNNMVDLEFALEKLKKDIQNTKVAPSSLDVIIRIPQTRHVQYNEVQPLAQSHTEDKIISRLGGQDLTKGSCASLSLAYAGNKGGLDVLDFRGGESQRVFAQNSFWRALSGRVKSYTQTHLNEITCGSMLLQKIMPGKEYILVVGLHAAIVRKTASGYEYLELQGTVQQNGFQPFTNRTFADRFGCKRSRSLYGRKYMMEGWLIDIEELQRDSRFKELLGYINTDESSQMKGKGGYMK